MFPWIKVMPKCVFAELPQTYQLSEAELKFYDDNGYLVIKELIDFASLYTYKQRFSQYAKGLVRGGQLSIVKEPSLIGTGVKGEQLINKVQDILHDSVFSTYTENPRLLHVVSQFIGDDITAIHSMMINKPPGTGRHPSHQDMFYFPIRPVDKIIGTWTAVDDVTVENGCLYAVPGSHKTNVLHPHEDNPDTSKLYHSVRNEDILAAGDRRVPLEMSPGDTVFLHPLLVHGSGANTSKNYRKAISCHYANSNCQYVDLSGTVQEVIAEDIKASMKKIGYEDLSFTDAFRFRTKTVKGVKCNL